MDKQDNLQAILERKVRCGRKSRREVLCVTSSCSGLPVEERVLPDEPGELGDVSEIEAPNTRLRKRRRQ